VPRVTPAVAWSVAETREWSRGLAARGRPTARGRVDNGEFPAISVEICMTP